MRLALVFAFLTAFVSMPARAQVAGGDAAHGYVIATEFCAQCHIVTDPQVPPLVLAVPSFFDIAQRSTTTALSLKAFLLTPHDRMPNYVVSPSDMDDVIAYILGLRERERRPLAPPPAKPSEAPVPTTPTKAVF